MLQGGALIVGALTLQPSREPAGNNAAGPNRATRKKYGQDCLPGGARESRSRRVEERRARPRRGRMNMYVRTMNMCMNAYIEIYCARVIYMRR